MFLGKPRRSENRFKEDFTFILVQIYKFCKIESS